MRRLFLFLMSILLMFTLSVPVLAADDVHVDGYPNIPSGSNPWAMYYYWFDTSGVLHGAGVTISAVEPKFDVENSSILFARTGGASFNLTAYYYDALQSKWISEASVRNSQGYALSVPNFSYFIYSSTEKIYDTDGNLFFRVSPLTKVRPTVETALNLMVPQVDGAMKTLALCGVGCLALLVVCPTLLRGLRIFLS